MKVNEQSMIDARSHTHRFMPDIIIDFPSDWLPDKSAIKHQYFHDCQAIYNSELRL